MSALGSHHAERIAIAAFRPRFQKCLRQEQNRDRASSHLTSRSITPPTYSPFLPNPHSPTHSHSSHLVSS